MNEPVFRRAAENLILAAEGLPSRAGTVPNVVFPTGAIVRGDELWMYYGAADSHVCLATARLRDVMDVLEGRQGRS